MPDRHLHIVSFDIPFPPNYGGVIDVFYKLKALYDEGIRIHLHCFEYNRPAAPELESFCDSIHYYRRRTGFFSAISTKPYIVMSRRSDELLQNLLRDDHPILFEGMHSCYLIDNQLLKDRKKIYRESNIEHHYYYSLFKAEKNVVRKLYFLLASAKLKHYERVLKHASVMMAVSQKDAQYLKKRFLNKQILYLPSFHTNNALNVRPGKGDYTLYHGNLSVAENYEAALFLIRDVFSRTQHRLIIAGLNPPQFLSRVVTKHSNITLIKNPDEKQMFDLISHAHINLLITFQATGLKLKLLNTLFNGRFVLVNDLMLNGTGLNEACRIANTPEEILREINLLSKLELSKEEIYRREKTLLMSYSNTVNARKLIENIF